MLMVTVPAAGVQFFAGLAAGFIAAVLPNIARWAVAAALIGLATGLGVILTVTGTAPIATKVGWFVQAAPLFVPVVAGLAAGRWIGTVLVGR